jgi:hypothetical protein
MSDDFRGHEDMEVPLPIEGENKVIIPELFIKRESFKTGEYERNEKGKFKRDSKGKKIPILKYGWTVSNIEGSKSINKTRQISSRKNKPVIELSTAKVDKIHEEPHYIPRLADFPNLEDRRLIFEYLTHLHPDEEHSFPHNKTRGLPPLLLANWEHHNLGPLPENYVLNYNKPKKQKKEKKVSHEDIFGESDSDKDSESDKDMFGSDTESEPPTPPPKKKNKKIIPVSQLEPDSEEEEEQQGAGGGDKRGRGRPRKHMTADEAYKAKIKSNKDKRAERALEARRLKIQEKLSKGEKLTKKERELHEAEGSGIKEDTDPCWKGYEMVGMKTKKGKKVPNCVPTESNIDFDKVKWGTFTALYKRFLKFNPELSSKITNLEQFSKYVLNNKDKFSKKAEKKALFYQNIIDK